MKIVISGATGYIGRSLIKRLLEEKNEIYALVRDTSNTSYIKQYIDEDKILNILNNKELLYEKMQKVKPEVFIHLAGKFLSEHSKSDIDELLDSNIRTSTIILDAVCTSGCKMIINTGSY